ncbi:MAG: WG repeat-containing protein [Acidobacteriales bacterium]|nr:WG repeat-containing protein [Terriglobales bacterium]
MPLTFVAFALLVLIPFQNGGMWGYRDNSGRIVIPPRYQVAQAFSPEGLAAVVDDGGWAYIDTAGRTVIRPLVVDNGPDYFREGVARFRRDGKVGFFNTRGTVVIKPAYAYAMPFSEGLAAVCDGCIEMLEGEHRAVKGGKWGFIDRRGVLVIPLQFLDAGSFQNGRARVLAVAGWRYIGKDGKAAEQEGTAGPHSPKR